MSQAEIKHDWEIFDLVGNKELKITINSFRFHICLVRRKEAILAGFSLYILSLI